MSSDDHNQNVCFFFFMENACREGSDWPNLRNTILFFFFLLPPVPLTALKVPPSFPPAAFLETFYDCVSHGIGSYFINTHRLITDRHGAMGASQVLLTACNHAHMHNPLLQTPRTYTHTSQMHSHACIHTHTTYHMYTHMHAPLPLYICTITDSTCLVPFSFASWMKKFI